MTRALRRIGVALLLTAAASAAFAQQPDEIDQDDEAVLTEEFILFPEYWAPGSNNEGRKDVREVTLPPPPSGPASIFCSPGSTICP